MCRAYVFLPRFHFDARWFVTFVASVIASTLPKLIQSVCRRVATSPCHYITSNYRQWWDERTRRKNKQINLINAHHENEWQHSGETSEQQFDDDTFNSSRHIRNAENAWGTNWFFVYINIYSAYLRIRQKPQPHRNDKFFFFWLLFCFSSSSISFIRISRWKCAIFSDIKVHISPSRREWARLCERVCFPSLTFNIK